MASESTNWLKNFSVGERRAFPLSYSAMFNPNVGDNWGGVCSSRNLAEAGKLTRYLLSANGFVAFE
jgi:hypothetical protein